MSASLANRVRGEQVPLNGVRLRLLEVIVDDQDRPLWRARCLQTGKLLTVALDGLVQVPVSSVAERSEADYLGARKRERSRRRWKFIAWSLLLAVLAFALRENLAVWAGALWEFFRTQFLSSLSP